MIKVVTDSTCDIPAGMAEQLGITVVPMLVEIDGVMYKDGVNLTREQFYAGLPTYKNSPKTAAGAPGDFADAYRELAGAGATHILSIHIARNFSGVCASADIAARDVAAEGIDVRVVDSGNMALGLGFPVLEAARRAQQGADLEDITRAVDDYIRRTRVFAMTETLKYLRKSGRANTLVAGIGELLHLRLLLELAAGELTQLDRIRTRHRAIERLVECARGQIKDTPQELAVLFTPGDGVDADVEHIRRELEDVLPYARHLVTNVTPVIGAHFGPQALGVVVVNPG